jgi:hypothetical protein
MNQLDSEITALSNSLLYELTKALGLNQNSIIGRALCPLFKKATLKFAEIGVGLDRVVAESGVVAGARWALPRFVRNHLARGVENIPGDGPLLIAANHPAAYDSLVISAHVPRPDFKIIVGDIPFFQQLPHISQHAIYAPNPDNVPGRMQTIRKSIRHLQAGGALLIFARGGIEADPAFMPNPDAEFELWSRSLEIFLQRVPNTRILVTIVSGVIARSTFHHPITWMRRKRPDKQRLAFMLQMIRQILTGKELFGLVPHVSFGNFIGLSDMNNPKEVLYAITQSARNTLQSHLIWQNQQV